MFLPWLSVYLFGQPLHWDGSEVELILEVFACCCLCFGRHNGLLIFVLFVSLPGITELVIWICLLVVVFIAFIMTASLSLCCLPGMDLRRSRQRQVAPQVCPSSTCRCLRHLAIKYWFDLQIFLQKSLCVHDHRTIISTFCNFLLIPHSPVKAVAQASMVFPLHTLKICVDQRKKISLDQPKNIYICWSKDKEVRSSSSLSTPHPEAGSDADGQDHEVLEHQNLKYNIEEKLKTKLKRDSELHHQNLISTEKSGLLELVGQSGQSKDLSQLRGTVGQQKGNRE